MGSVSCARKRNEYVGGSAYTKKSRGWFGRVIEERKDAPLEVIGDSNMKLYALKSIILSRVSVRTKNKAKQSKTKQNTVTLTCTVCPVICNESESVSIQ